MDTGLTEKGRKEIAEGLEILLADTYTLYLKTQGVHWNYIGSEFFSVHKLLEGQYEEMAEAVDEIAERVRALGYFVSASFAFFQKKSHLSHKDEELSPPEMIEDLVTSQEGVICFLRKLCQVAEKENDGATVDMLGKRLAVHEKSLWMLKNYL